MGCWRREHNNTFLKRNRKSSWKGAFGEILRENSRATLLLLVVEGVVGGMYREIEVTLECSRLIGETRRECG